MRVDLYREATLSRASPLAQEPFSKHVRTKKSSYCGETLSQASPLAQEPFSKHLGTRVCALTHTTRRRFLGQALSHKSLSQRTLLQRRAGSHIHSYCGEALSRANPLAHEPFSKHSWTKRRQRLHSCLVPGQSVLEQPLSRKSLSQSILGQGIWRVRSLILRRSAFSSNSSRTISFLQAPSDKEVTALALNPLRCKAFSSYPSRTEGFLKALLGR